MYNIFFALIFFWSLPCWSQKSTIKIPGRYLLAGRKNYVDFSTKIKYDSVKFEVSQGTFGWEKKKLFLSPADEGSDSVFISLYRKSRLLNRDTIVAYVERPLIFPAYSGSRYAKLNARMLKAMGGVVFYVTINAWHWEPIDVSSYRFSIMREGKMIYSSLEKSRFYSNELRLQLDLLQTRDLIIISDISTTDDVPSVVEVQPGIFEIK